MAMFPPDHAAAGLLMHVVRTLSPRRIGGEAAPRPLHRFLLSSATSATRSHAGLRGFARDDKR